MKNGILILIAAFLLNAAPDIRAHNLIGMNGKTQDHQHVYRRQEYGKPLQQGHRIQAAGGNGMIIWGSDARPEYGKSTVRRDGPIIDDRNPGAGGVSTGNSGYDSAVRNYGKPVKGYGKPVQKYGTTGQKK